MQLGHLTDANERYNLYDYSYTSANSDFSRQHWINFAKEVSSELKLSPNTKIVEVGSNDGFLSSQFQKLGHKVIGVDPSHYMVRIAELNGVKTLPEIFTSESSNDIKNLTKEVDLVCANNVLNHSNDPLDFVRGVNNILGPDGVFVFEVPYWMNTINSGKFDQIYHEHVSYFTVKSCNELLKKTGFEIFNIEVVDYHGGSLRVYAKKMPNVWDMQKQNDIVREMIEKEVEAGLFKLEIYENYMLDIINKRNKFLNKIYEIKSQGKHIIGVGAAAKGNTFLNFYGIDKNVLDYVTDSSPHKQGKYTPITRIPIAPDEIFSEYDEVFAVILSWNISASLKNKLTSINNKVQYLTLVE